MLPMQVIYCFIPKSGCTTWKRTLAKAIKGAEGYLKTEESIHTDQFLRSHGVMGLYSFRDSEIDKRLKTYFKFLVVRHPMERLVSAFRDKFEKTTDFLNFAEKIRKMGGNKNSDLSL